MNTNFPFLPERPSKPRNSGITMMMDKGLSLNEAENFIDSSAEFTDIVKFGFGTAVFAKQLKEKIEAYRKADLMVYFGGTLFEKAVLQDKVKELEKQDKALRGEASRFDADPEGIIRVLNEGAREMGS